MPSTIRISDLLVNFNYFIVVVLLRLESDNKKEGIKTQFKTDLMSTACDVAFASRPLGISSAYNTARNMVLVGCRVEAFARLRADRPTTLSLSLSTHDATLTIAIL